MHDTSSLRGDDRVQDWIQTAADWILQCVFGHFDCASVMGYHLTHEVAVNPVCCTGISHIGKHGLGDPAELALILIEVLFRLGNFPAGVLDITHVIYTFCLGSDYI